MWWARVLHCVLTSRLPSGGGNHSTSFSLFIRKWKQKKEELKSTTIVANFVSHLRTPNQAKVPSRQSSSREVQLLPSWGGTILPRAFPWESFGFGKSRNFYCHYLLLARNEISQLFGFWNTLKIVFKWWSLRKIINSELENLNIFLFFDYSEKMHYLGR